jgi:hypothetical protein
MGIEIDREEFTAEDHAAFAEQLQYELQTLRELLARPGFGEGAASIGTEVEMHLADAASQAACVNKALLATLDDPRCTLETNAFNFEVNAAPLALAGKPFTRLADDLRSLLGLVRRGAAKHGARVLLAGTLPTLTTERLKAGVMSDGARYRAMSRALRERRGEPFALRIDGHESLRAECDDIALEGTTASLQVHLRASPRDFPALFNAAQLGLGPLIAVTGNSPYFDRRCLWEETRIALFKHSVDTRLDENERTRSPSRVGVGFGYIRDAIEPFAQNVALYEPLMPVTSKPGEHEDGMPALRALRLHQGTVWSWNRAVFDPSAGGHLRVEHRAVACGPTIADMVANAALTLGLSLALAPRMAAVMPAFPFEYIERNMYRAAKHGLHAELAWPSERAPSPRPVIARQLLLELLPLAAAALIEHGVEDSEARSWLELVRARAQNGQTGSKVQQALVARHAGLARDEALARMVEAYVELSESGAPVHTWKL